MTWATRKEAIAACAEYGVEPEVVFQVSDGTWYAGDEWMAPAYRLPDGTWCEFPK